jgi:tetratricopeptide (TPR) repeat protein
LAKKRNKRKQKIPPVGKRAMPSTRLIDENGSGYQLLTYEVTFEPIPDDSIPEEVQDQMEDLVEKATRGSKEVIGTLEALIDKYPKVPKLYNFLSVAYSNLGNREQAKLWAEKNYLNNPEYIFARLNWAETCILEGNYEKVPEIFDHNFDIKAMYPARDVFHVTEVVGFMGVAGLYFAYTGKMETAEIFYRNLKKLAPDHPFTKRLKKRLLFKSVMRKTGLLRG